MIKLEATYSKKLGLPNFSSHCYVVSLSTELTELSQVEAESARLYALLQHTVDRELTEVGYLPDAEPRALNSSGNGSHGRNGTNGSSGRKPAPAAPSEEPEQRWACSDKQRDLVLRVVRENHLEKKEVEAMAQQLFGVGVTECNKLQASQLIEDLLEKVGKKSNGRSRWKQPARS